jgi:hypothetical protein
MLAAVTVTSSSFTAETAAVKTENAIRVARITDIIFFIKIKLLFVLLL